VKRPSDIVVDMSYIESGHPLLPTHEVSDFHRNFQQLQSSAKRQYSLRKVLLELCEKPAHVGGMEREVSEELQKLNPLMKGGTLIPAEVFGIQRRDLTTGTLPTVVQTSISPDEPIPFLRVKTVAGRCGATLLNGLTNGNLSLPRAIATAGAGWAGETGPIPTADQDMDSIKLVPKLIAGQTIVSNQLLRQSSIDVEKFVLRDISDAISVQVDQAVLFGAGSATVPKGIMSYSANAPGASAYGLRAPNTTFAAAATWGDILSFEKNLEDCRVYNDDGTFAYVSSPATRTKWQAAPVVATFPRFLWEQRDDEADGRINGRKAVSSAQMTGDIVLLGKWSECLIGTWLGFEILVNSHSRAINAETVIQCLALIDVQFRYASAFCASTNSGAQ
jgi:hypothetical protein